MNIEKLHLLFRQIFNFLRIQFRNLFHKLEIEMRIDLAFDKPVQREDHFICIKPPEMNDRIFNKLVRVSGVVDDNLPVLIVLHRRDLFDHWVFQLLFQPVCGKLCLGFCDGAIMQYTYLELFEYLLQLVMQVKTPSIFFLLFRLKFDLCLVLFRRNMVVVSH